MCCFLIKERLMFKYYILVIFVAYIAFTQILLHKYEKITDALQHRIDYMVNNCKEPTPNSKPDLDEQATDMGDRYFE